MSYAVNTYNSSPEQVQSLLDYIDNKPLPLPSLTSNQSLYYPTNHMNTLSQSFTYHDDTNIQQLMLPKPSINNESRSQSYQSTHTNSALQNKKHKSLAIDTSHSHSHNSNKLHVPLSPASSRHSPGKKQRGVSCHQCKSTKSLDQLMFCCKGITSTKKRKCRKKYACTLMQLCSD